VSQEAPIKIVLRFSNSAAASWKACNSVGHTKVKSFGYQNKITFFTFFNRFFENVDLQIVA